MREHSMSYGENPPHRPVLQVVSPWPPSPLDTGEEVGRGRAAGDRRGIVVSRRRACDIQGDDLNLTAWNHDPQRLQSVLDHWGRAVWKPRYHVLSVPGLFGYVLNMAALHERTPCKPGLD
jgi:hypothetical protein